MSDSPSYTDLIAFQRDCLLAIASLETDQPAPPTGPAVRRWLDTRYEGINDARVYQNLNGLVERGLIEKGQHDRRTNTYRTTERGRELLSERFDELTTALGRLDTPTRRARS